MTTSIDSPPSLPLAPLPADQRIEALDVARGFALIGICMMNVEYFNRAMATIGTGMPPGLTGINWLASFFVAYFVTGKFWTIFSFLFGMGFAVMLTRAEQSGRSFLKPYLRRLLALAAFGTFHHIFIWAGDILFSYAVGAVFLLLVLYGTWKWMLGGLVVLVGLAFVPGMGPFAGSFAAATGFAGLVAIYMRNEKPRLNMPLFSLILMVVAGIAALAAVAMIGFKQGPAEARPVPLIISVLLLVIALLAKKFHHDAPSRAWRAGAAVYLFSVSIMTAMGLVMLLAPPDAPVAPKALEAARSRLAAKDAEEKAKKDGLKAAPKADGKAVAKADVASVPPAGDKAASKPDNIAAPKADAKPGAAKKAEPTEEEKAADKVAEREKRLKENAEKAAAETKAMTTGSYVDAVRERFKSYVEGVPSQGGFATILIGMFLLGTWFIRSGVMDNTGAHLPMFRKLAFIGLPFGIGLGLLGATISMTHIPGNQHDGFQLATGLLMMGNLPASIGYVSMIVLMLHSAGPWSRVRVLAPLGRMALTNYLMQSVVGSLVFYGYGLGYWGTGRALQLVYVVVLIACQVAFSHWWLSQFRYGPMEWLWRAFTYMKLPAMRLNNAEVGLQAQPTS